jgi:hypothetical protein
MKKWLLLVPLLLGLSMFCSGQAVTTLDQNCNVWGANPTTAQCGGTTAAASGTQLFFPDIRGTITNQFEVVVQGTAPATLTVTVVGCMRGGTCGSTLASSSGTTSQILTPATSALNVFDKYGITVSWTGGDATTRFVVNRTGTVAKLAGGGSGTITAGTTNVLAKYTAATTLGNSSVTDNGTIVTSAESFNSLGGTSAAPAFNVASTDGVHGSGMYQTQVSQNLNFSINGTELLLLQSGSFFIKPAICDYNVGNNCLTLAAGLISVTGAGNALFKATNGLSITNLLASSTAPTIAAAGCGGGAASITANNGTAAFKIGVGTTPGSACTVTMPAATTGWNCHADDITTQSSSVFVQKQTGAESTTSVTITNFNTAAAATAFTASDVLKVTCSAD